jgi:hypothetical protein
MQLLVHISACGVNLGVGKAVFLIGGASGDSTTLQCHHSSQCGKPVITSSREISLVQIYSQKIIMKTEGMEDGNRFQEMGQYSNPQVTNKGISRHKLNPMNYQGVR